MPDFAEIARDSTPPDFDYIPGMVDVLTIPGFDDICFAAARLRGIIRRTPVIPLELPGLESVRIALKCENLQVSGSFKYRGVNNAMALLQSVADGRAVATHSSGNHGYALAHAAKRVGVSAHVVVPTTISIAKYQLIRDCDAHVYQCDPTVAAREAMLASVVAETDAAIIHPYDDANVIAGQGTAALELLEDEPELDVIIAPVSGGGLMSGTALAAHGVEPAIEVLGAEPELAGDAAISLSTGFLSAPFPTGGSTIADGLRASLCERTFTILSRHVGHVITVSEAEIMAAMRLVWERAKLVIEPSSAVPIAAILRESKRFQGKRVGVIVTGGNVALDEVPWK